MRRARARALRRCVRASRNPADCSMSGFCGLLSSFRSFFSTGGGARLKAALRFFLMSNCFGPPGHVSRAFFASGPIHSFDSVSLIFALVCATAPADEAAKSTQKQASSGYARVAIMETLPPARGFDDLSVEAELVSPVLALERPEQMLFVGLHHAEDLGFSLRHATLGELAGVLDGDTARQLQRVLHLLAEPRALKLRGSLLESS